MKCEARNTHRTDILGNGRKSDQEIFSSLLKRWQKRFGYLSVFAAVPAIVASQLHVTRTVKAHPGAETNTGKPQSPRKLNMSFSSRSLLKRQSEFRLPHQSASNVSLAPLGGPDDCPGKPITPGTYTSAVPFVDSGDTTGANNTINTMYAYCAYSTIGTSGPDHIYSFTLSAKGAHPQIQISTSSSSYRPLIYFLDDQNQACPAGTGNDNILCWCFWRIGDSQSTTIDLSWGLIPINVPLHLVIDSDRTDSDGAGPYTIRMQDVTVAPLVSPNQIDGSEFFVSQHYRDFLNSEPDPEGMAFSTNQMTSCGGDQGCIEVRRINDSGAFFLSIEFQENGYLAYRTYLAAYGRLPSALVPITFSEFVPDSQAIGHDVIVRQPGWQTALENNKRSFFLDFVLRPRFTTAFPPAMSAQEFVDKLNSNAGNPLSQTERDQLVSDLAGGRLSRAEALRLVAENQKLVQVEFNRAFVLMQYFGYLRRNPNDAPDGNFVGYNFWLEKLDRFNGDFIAAEMVKAFLSSIEYRRRFGP